MLARAAAGIVGVSIVGCLAHSAILTYAGGYDSPTAPMMIGLALGLVVGSAVVGICWRQRRVTLAILIGATIVAGEAYNLILTAERTVALREANLAPLRAAEVVRSKALNRTCMVTGDDGASNSSLPRRVWRNAAVGPGHRLQVCSTPPARLSLVERVGA